jgi:hypothetical protein
MQKDAFLFKKSARLLNNEIYESSLCKYVPIKFDTRLAIHKAGKSPASP